MQSPASSIILRNVSAVAVRQDNAATNSLDGPRRRETAPGHGTVGWDKADLCWSCQEPDSNNHEHAGEGYTDHAVMRSDGKIAT